MTTLAFIGTGTVGTGSVGTGSPGTQAIIRPGLNLVQLHNELWRVTRPCGEVLGYIERFAVHAGVRFRAKRFIARQRRFVEVGEFWRMDDAVDCFGF
ncbi:hypothetical protein [Frigoribacterium sp. CG_9.8]|uniref:hypothetical protein n=1 Tax=Frigoribacterium sp. CG_9.8 TaxID=2787733 RepID=UPI001A2511F9|nr:hypothetical protein [Frigoribacterium sp. CG_9.8]MBG6107161.1 hypothetical protein [Frigoribacterium sp. CG_9.8]